MFNAVEISKDIYWVGVIEWNERYIHGFSMPEGSTNNAYIIKDEKTVLVDTCVDGYSDELIARISDVVEISSIDYIISNHSEKDHAGALGKILELAPNATIVTSDPKGLRILQRYYGEDLRFHPVKTGDELDIGKRTLSFVLTPMVHWPDNMVTYSKHDKILFSNDAFGQFFATSKRFDDEVDDRRLFEYAKKYFANIILPYTRQTAKALDTLDGIGIDLIAPSHGVVWRSHVSRIMDLYRTWCDNEPTDSAVVIYSTIYGSTARMATAITEAFMKCNVAVRLYDLDISDISDIMVDCMDAKYIAIGSPTHNATVLPPMGQFLAYFKGLAPKNRIGIPFGSYGWAQSAQNEIASVFSEKGYSMPLDNCVCDWNEDGADAQSLYDAIIEMIEDNG